MRDGARVVQAQAETRKVEKTRSTLSPRADGLRHLLSECNI